MNEEIAGGERQQRIVAFDDTRWNRVHRRLRAVWPFLVGVTVFVVGVVFYVVFSFVVLAKMLILGGLGWIARDTSMAIFSRFGTDTASRDVEQPESTPADAIATPSSPTPEQSGMTSADVKERIVALLDANDGQLRQKQLVEQLDRSKATVSKHLSDLADSGEVVKSPRGRENIVYRPDAVPDQVRVIDQSRHSAY